MIAAGAVLAFLGLVPWVGPWWAAGIAGALTGAVLAVGGCERRCGRGGPPEVDG